jgi:hypothetical protein
VCTEEQHEYLQGQYEAIANATCDGERHRLFEETKEWQEKNITAEQRHEMKQMANMKQTASDACNVILDEVDKAMAIAERGILADLGVDESLLIQHDSLVGMEANMLNKPTVSEFEKDVIRKTHTEWLSKNLSAEDYQKFRGMMESKCNALSSEYLSEIAGVEDQFQSMKM